MSDLEIKASSDQVSLSGRINYDTVNQALAANIFQNTSSLNVDFSAVGHADSSALALMVHWLRESRQKNVQITFSHIPKKLVALAEMSSLREVLPLA